MRNSWVWWCILIKTTVSCFEHSSLIGTPGSCRCSTVIDTVSPINNIEEVALQAIEIGITIDDDDLWLLLATFAMTVGYAINCNMFYSFNSN